MAPLSFVTFLVVVLMLKTGQCHIWSYVSFTYPVNLAVRKSFNCDSNILCASRCSSFFPEILMVANQNELCYCLETPLNLFGSEDKISLPSFYSRIPEACISKGYQALPDLGLCVKLSAHKTHWTIAKATCNQDGGYLINLNTDQKFTVVLNMTEDYSENHFLIGGSTDSLPAARTDFKWTRGGVVEDRHWVKDEPTGGEKCLGLLKMVYGKGFGDVPCTTWAAHFICEILF